jgi:hypothetical protein
MPRVTLSAYSLFLEKNYQQALQFAFEHRFQDIEIRQVVFVFSKDGECKGNLISSATHFCDGDNLGEINEGHLAFP